jgi:hypothetical protein
MEPLPNIQPNPQTGLLDLREPENAQPMSVPMPQSSRPGANATRPAPRGSAGEL